MAEPITGKVAKIIDNRTVVINRGLEHGVKVGMRFAIIDPSGDEVVDPDTGEKLGAIGRTKVHVQVNQVQPKFSFASTFRQVDFSSFFASSGALSTGPETFTYEGTAAQVRPADSRVRIGDPVVQDLTPS